MRPIHLLSCVGACAIVLAAQGNAATDAGAPAVQLVFQLSDGSLVAGATSLDRLKITTHYAHMEIPFSRMRGVVFDSTDHAARVNFQNGDHLSGRLDATEIAVKTATGQTVVPLAKVRQIRVGTPGGALPAGLVLYYSFDSDEGGRAADTSGGGNDGKVQGARDTSEGKVFGAMNFSGDGDAVIVGNPACLRLQDFTIMAWIRRGDTDKVSTTTEYGEIFGYGHGGYVMGIHQEGYIYLSQADVHIGSTSPFQIHDKDFHHIAVTKQGTKFAFYLDGAAYPADDYQTDGDFVFDTDAAVGARADDLHKCFIGLIDEVAVFKRPLSADEVKAIYEAQK